VLGGWVVFGFMTEMRVTKGKKGPPPQIVGDFVLGERTLQSLGGGKRKR